MNCISRGSSSVRRSSAAAVLAGVIGRGVYDAHPVIADAARTRTHARPMKDRCGVVRRSAPSADDSFANSSIDCIPPPEDRMRAKVNVHPDDARTKWWRVETLFE